jgi:hypothetical protein
MAARLARQANRFYLSDLSTFTSRLGRNKKGSVAAAFQNS